ncbi:MAG: hypothetical protein ACRDU8_03665 [Egibacteraceae bacterium]
MTDPPAALRDRLEAALGATTAWRATTGGYTRAHRFVVTFTDGRTAFVKATADGGGGTTDWLRAEWTVTSQVRGPFLPRVVTWLDDDPPALVLEDLSDGHWPPPWPDGAVGRVRRRWTRSTPRSPQIGSVPPRPSATSSTASLGSATTQGRSSASAWRD